MYDPNNISIIPRSRMERELASKSRNKKSASPSPGSTEAPPHVVLHSGRVLDDAEQVLSAVDGIVSHLQAGSHVVVRVSDAVEVKLRNVLDTRVGAGEITKDQADSVVFEVLSYVAPEKDDAGVVGDSGPKGEAGPAGEPDPEPEVKKPTKKKTIKKKPKPKIKKKETSRGKTAKVDDLLPEELSDIFSGDTATFDDDDDDE